MAIVFDAVSTSGFLDNSVTSLTWPHTVGSGADRLLLVGVRTRDNGSNAHGKATAVTFNGTSLTLLRENQVLYTTPDQYITVQVWGLVAPSVTTANVVATMAGVANFGCFVASSFFGVNQTTPIEAYGDTSAGDPSYVANHSSTVTTVSANAMMASFMYSAATLASLDVGPASSDNVATPNNDRCVSATSSVVVPATTTHTWNTAGEVTGFAAIAVSIAPFTPTRRNEARIVSVPGAGANTLFTISQNPVGKLIQGSQ